MQKIYLIEQTLEGDLYTRYEYSKNMTMFYNTHTKGYDKLLYSA